MRATVCRLGLAALCTAILVLAVSTPVQAELGDPINDQPFYADRDREGDKHLLYPPGSGFEGPCGVAVEKNNLYVADYYHNVVDVFNSATLDYRRQIAEVEPRDAAKQMVDGPCGLALDSTSALYVNNYHRNVVKFGPFASTIKGPGTTIDAAHPTGVAVEPVTDDVYVDDRTYVAVYEPSGVPVQVAGEPLRIGEGSLGDGYGVAVSGFPGAPGQPSTAGYVYVPDAADGTVKVYDPTIDDDQPSMIIDGDETPLGGFVSLRDSAIAVDQASGLVYVADNLQPQFSERPEAAIYAFEADGSYAGRLKHNVVDALPPGLAIGQGRVYVTSGNTEDAYLDIYAAGELTVSAFPPRGGGPASAPPAGSAGASVPALVAAATASSLVAPSQTAVPGLSPSSLAPKVPRQRHHKVRRHRNRHRHQHPQAPRRGQ